MKKFLLWLAFVFLLWWTSYAYDHCFDFSGSDEVCVSVDRVSNGKFHFDGNIRGHGVTICHVLTPDGELQLINGCDGYFTYHGGGTKDLKMYVRYDLDYETEVRRYNFDNGSFSSSSYSHSNNSYNYNNYSNNNYNNHQNNYYNNHSNTNYQYNNNNHYNRDYLDRFTLHTSDTHPRVGEQIDVTVSAIDDSNKRFYDYDGRVYFTVEEKRSNTRSSASQYDYDLDYSSYNFTSYDDGSKRFNNFLSFDDPGNFRLKVRAGNVTDYLYIYVQDDGSYSYNNYSLDDIELSSDDITPYVGQDVNLTLELVDRHNKRLRNSSATLYFSVQEKVHNSRRSASSRDYDLRTTRHTVRSNDNGYVSLRDHISFDAAGDYRVKVSNNDGVTSYLYFDVSRRSTSHHNNYSTQSYNNHYNNNYSNNNYHSNSYNSNYPNYTYTTASTHWFSSADRQLLRRVYNQWPSYIDRMEQQHSNLRHDGARQRIQSDIYANMNKVVNNKACDWDNYEDFHGDLLVFISYTVSIR